MRERIYIISCPDWDDITCKNKSLTYKNVMMYSEKNKGIYLNGVRYGSLNKLSDFNNGILFSLSLDNYNVIRLSQEEFKTAGVEFYYKHKKLTSGGTIMCHVGERIQILSDVPTNIYNNKQYFWSSTNSDIALIDRNNIIMPLVASDENESIQLKSPDGDILFSIKLKIFKEYDPFSADIYNNNDDANSLVIRPYIDETFNHLVQEAGRPIANVSTWAADLPGIRL